VWGQGVLCGKAPAPPPAYGGCGAEPARGRPKAPAGDRGRGDDPRRRARHARSHLGEPLRPCGGDARHQGQGPDEGPAPLTLRAPAKTKARHAHARDTPRVPQARAAYHAVMPPLAVEPYQCMDASGMPLAMTRWCGRAPRGDRGGETVPHNYGPNVTRSGALALQALDAVRTIDGATEGDVVQA
jgi:hypothetical protein